MVNSFFLLQLIELFILIETDQAREFYQTRDNSGIVKASVDAQVFIFVTMCVCVYVYGY